MTAQRVALVTGASRGIGFETARLLARRGFHIVALARTQGGLEALDDAIRNDGNAGGATLIPAALSDIDALEAVGPLVAQRFGRLDAFIANAGMLGDITPVAHSKMTLWRKVFDVNVHANAQLIRTLDPLLRAAPRASAVFVTSSVASAPRAYWNAYAASKAALDMMVKTYALECAGTNIDVQLFNPGATRTSMRAQAMPGEDPATLPAAADTAARLVALVKD